MTDHDQRFKSLLKAFFAEFFQAFFAAWADRFDFSRVDWLEQEVFTDPPRGQRRSLDLVARVPLRPGVPPPATATGEPADCWPTLIHIEIESRDSVALAPAPDVLLLRTAPLACSPFLGPVIMGVTCSLIQ